MDSSPTSHVTSSQQSALFRRFLTNYFGVLDEKILDEIFSQCQWLELEGGDTLFSQGDVGDAGIFLFRTMTAGSIFTVPINSWEIALV